MSEQDTKPKDGSSEKQAGGFDPNKIKNIVIHHAKIVLAALAIWTVGWAGLHHVWVLMGLLIFGLWRMNQKEKDKRMKSLLEVTKNEQKALAQIKNLPSWVSLIIKSIPHSVTTYVSYTLLQLHSLFS